jgi:hypothetical protein
VLSKDIAKSFILHLLRCDPSLVLGVSFAVASPFAVVEASLAG